MEPFARSQTAASIAAMAAGIAPGSANSVLLKQTEWERRMETADRQQAEIAMLQTGLVRDQLALLAREMVNIRSEVESTRVDLDRKFSSARDLIGDERAAREANHAAAMSAVQSVDMKMQQEVARLREEAAAAEQRTQNALTQLRNERQRALDELAAELRASVAGNTALIRELEAKHETTVSAMARLDAQREAGDAELREQLALSHDRMREQLLNLSEAMDRERADRFQQDTAVGQRLDRECRGIWEAIEQIRIQISPKVVVTTPVMSSPVLSSEFRAVSPTRVMATEPLSQGSLRMSPLGSTGPSAFTTVASPPSRLLGPAVTMARSPSNPAINIPSNMWTEPRAM